MNIKLFSVIVFVLCCILSCTKFNKTKNDFLLDTTEILFQEIALSLPTEGVISINDFDNDHSNVVKDKLSQLLNDKTKLMLQDSNNLDKLFQKQLLQDDIAFNDEKYDIGNFQKSRYLVIGSITYKEKTILGKLFQKSSVSIKIDDIYSGSNLISYQIFNDNKTKLPVFIFLIFIFFLFIIMQLVNFFSKGYHTKLLLLCFIFLSLIYSLWFWVL